jgi:transposase
MGRDVLRDLTKWCLGVGLKDYGEKKLIKMRQRVNDLHFLGCISIRRIAREMRMSRDFVRKWTRSKGQDVTIDGRGWPRGHGRRWSKLTEQRVKGIYGALMADAGRFFAGATAIAQEWRQQYPGESVPPLRTIGRMLKALGLSQTHKKGRHKGAARYLCYPEHTIYHELGGRVLEADFIGPKHIRGRTEPVNFIGFAFKQEPRLRYYKRVCGQTAEAVIDRCGQFFKEFERPDYVKVDNTSATIGSASGKRNISRVMRFLLVHGIVPIFAVPRKPFSQASIEGNNAVFSRKFWNRIEFTSVAEVDEKVEWFNKDSLWYLNYQKPSHRRRRSAAFVPRVYFIRQVKEHKTKKGRGFIDVLHENIFLPSSYINFFVLAEWNLQTETLAVYFEKDEKSKQIKKVPFAINEQSRKRVSKVLKI